MASLIRTSWLASLLLLAACAPSVSTRPLLSQQMAARRPVFETAYEAGKSHLRAGRPGLALVMFERALIAQPLSVAALNGIGVCYDQLHRPDKATPYYRKALAMEPNSSDTLNNMGMSALIAGDRRRARQSFAQALDRQPGDPVILANARLAQDPKPAAEIDTTADRRPQLEVTGSAKRRLLLASESGSGRHAFRK
jgi:Flp pilus assembly protein TadD